MGNNLSRRTPADLALSQSTSDIERHANASPTDIYNRGVRDIVAQKVQAAKAMHAQKLIADIHKNAHDVTHDLYADMQARLEGSGLSAEFQARFEAFTHDQLTHYENHTHANSEVGARMTAKEAYNEVNLPPVEKKKWWQR